MTDQEKGAAEEGLRQKLVELQAELDRVLRARKETQGLMEGLEEQARTLSDRDHSLAGQEGVLRGQIGELERALEAFDTS